MSIISFIARWLIWATLIILFVHNVRNPKVSNSASPPQTTQKFVVQNSPTYPVAFLDATQLYLRNTEHRSEALTSAVFARFVRGYPLSAHWLQFVHTLRAEAEADLSALGLYEDSLLGDLSAAKYRMIRIITLQIGIFDELLSRSNRHIKPGNAYHKQKLHNLERKLHDFNESKANLVKFYKQKLQELNFYTSTASNRKSG